MCLRGRTGAHYRAQDHRRQVGAPSVQFSPVILCNLRPVLTPRSPHHWFYLWAPSKRSIYGGFGVGWHSVRHRACAISAPGDD